MLLSNEWMNEIIDCGTSLNIYIYITCFNLFRYAFVMVNKVDKIGNCYLPCIIIEL